MKRNVINLLLGFLIGMGIAMGARASTFPQNFPPIESTLTQQERDYLASRPWLLSMFKDLPGGIEVRFGSNLVSTGDSFHTIDFKLGTQYSADIKKACEERVGRIADALRGQGNQILSRACFDIVNSLDPSMKKIKGQVIYRTETNL